jgi:integrase
MLAWAVERKLIGSNPLAGIKPLLRGHLKEGRALSDDEVERLLNVGRPIWRDVWYALLVTGMRKDELANLRLSDIDWQGRELIIRSHHAKNKKERRIPIDDRLFEILQRQAAKRPIASQDEARLPR